MSSCVRAPSLKALVASVSLRRLDFMARSASSSTGSVSAEPSDDTCFSSAHRAATSAAMAGAVAIPRDQGSVYQLTATARVTCSLLTSSTTG